MASRPLTRIRGIDPTTCRLLQAAGMSTVRDLLLASPLKIMSAADLSFKDMQALLTTVTDSIVPESTNALTCLRERASKQRFLSTGMLALDQALHGGLLLGTLTDICGAPGVGKTAFCIGCVVQAAQSAGVVYIDTEHKFDPIRLVQIATEAFPKVYSSSFRSDASHMVDSLLKTVTVKRPATVAEFEAVLGELQELAIAGRVGLVVIDSIAALVRKEGLDQAQREAIILSSAASLKRLAEACHLTVLATNQVTPVIGDVLQAGSGGGDSFNPFNETIGITMASSSSSTSTAMYQPTLGATWHHCLSTRLSLHTTEEGSAAQEQRTAVQGIVAVTKSPIAPQAQLPYVIGSRGLQIVS